jgi:uncharacterized protein DUF1761
MDFGSINWLAVVVCVIVNFVVGSLWFNPKTFFPAWWKGMGKTGEPGMGGNMTMTWVLTFLAAVVQAIAMAFVVKSIGGLMPGGPTLANGAMVGFLLWLGFIAPTYLVNNLFAGHGFKVWAIEVGNHLVNFLLFGAILGAWR